jgi:hypothetical protein
VCCLIRSYRQLSRHPSSQMGVACIGSDTRDWLPQRYVRLQSVMSLSGQPQLVRPVRLAPTGPGPRRSATVLTQPLSHPPSPGPRIPRQVDKRNNEVIPGVPHSMAHQLSAAHSLISKAVQAYFSPRHPAISPGQANDKWSCNTPEPCPHW